MARLSGARRRLGALPGRAKAALAVAVLLIVALVVWGVVAVVGDDDAGDADATGGDGSPTSTTMATGDLAIDAPEGWQTIPVPALEFGIAVPPGWEAVLLSDEGLAALSGSEPAVPGFVENAHAARAEGGVLYAAGADAEGQVSDVLVGAIPESGVTDVAGLEALANERAAAAGGTPPEIEVVEDADRPTVQLQFRAGAGEGEAEGTETLVLGPRGIVWSVTVTSDDASLHDDLAEAITGTLAFSS
jgi:hypothetical protein